MGMSSRFDDEVRRAIERRNAERERSLPRRKAEQLRRIQEQEAEQLRRIQEREERERQLAEHKRIRDEALKAFKRDIAQTIQYLETRGVRPSVVVFPGPRTYFKGGSSTPIEVPEPLKTSGRLFRHKTAGSPALYDTKFRGWMISVKARSHEEIESYDPRSRWPYPDSGEVEHIFRWRTSWQEGRFLCTDGNIYKIASGDSGTAGARQWYLISKISGPAVSVDAIPSWQRKWHTRLVPVFAHGISLREPAGPADIDLEEVE
jgi:hypothetical protein